MVSPSNYREYAVGSTGSKVIARQDEGLVDVVFVLGDKAAIDSVKSGQTRQVSAGYTTKVVEKEDGKFYQTERRMNHVALVERGRAGETVRLHFDSEDEWAVQVNTDTENPIVPTTDTSTESPVATAETPVTSITEPNGETDRYITRDEFEKSIAQLSQPTSQQKDSPNQTIDSAPATSAEPASVPTDCNHKDTQHMKKWKGFSIEDEKLYDAISSMESDMETMKKKSKKDSDDSGLQVEVLTNEVKELKAKLDTAETELDKAQVKADMLQPEIDRLKQVSANRIDSDQVGAIVKRHLKVWDSARPYLGKETKLDAASQPIEVMKEAIRSKYPNLNMDGRKDEAIETAFEMLLQEHPVKHDEAVKEDPVKSSLDEAMTRAQINTEGREDSATTKTDEDKEFAQKLDADYDDIRKQYENAWKGGK